MSEARSAHIFEHYGFTYVLDFNHMTMWIVTDQDETSPITALKIRRSNSGHWSYRFFEDHVNDFTDESDEELEGKLEKLYESYLSSLIVDKNNDSGQQENLTTKVKKARVRPPNHRR